LVPSAGFPAINHPANVVEELFFPSSNHPLRPLFYNLGVTEAALEDADAADDYALGSVAELRGNPTIAGELASKAPLLPPHRA
jgi:hypothetical protein